MKTWNNLCQAKKVSTKSDDEETTSLTEYQELLAKEARKSKERVWIVLLCCSVASLTSLLSGMAAGITSPALQELNNENLTIPKQYFNNSSILASAFGAIELAGAMTGGILAWPISDGLGRKTALTLVGVPYLCGWLMVSYAIQITQSRAIFLTVLLIGRFVSGVGAGWSLFCTSLYCTEISSPKLKGIFGNFPSLSFTLGFLLSFFLGIKFGDFKFGYTNTSRIAVGITILFQFLMLMATYESPRWLFSKNMDYSATRTLMILRGKEYFVTKEIDDVRAKLRKKSVPIYEQLGALKKRAVLHPFILVVLIAVFKLFNGMTVVLYYATQIFTQAGYSDEMANILTFVAVGLVRLVFVIASAALVDCVGRRVLLLLSSIGTIISTCIMGFYFFILEKNCNNSLDSPECPNGIENVALFAMVLLVATYSIGWSPVATLTIMELLPNHVRALGGGIANFALWASAFFITLIFHPYTALVTPKFTWWTLTLFMVASIILVAVFIPEAKGRSLEEIQEHFEKGHVVVVKCTCARLCKKDKN